MVPFISRQSGSSESPTRSSRRCKRVPRIHGSASTYRLPHSDPQFLVCLSSLILEILMGSSTRLGHYIVSTILSRYKLLEITQYFITLYHNSTLLRVHHSVQVFVLCTSNVRAPYRLPTALVGSFGRFGPLYPWALCPLRAWRAMTPSSTITSVPDRGYFCCIDKALVL